MRLIVLALLLSLALPVWAAQPCAPCAVDGGTYQTVAPPGWDGVRPLRLLLFLHGWRQTGAQMTGDPHIAGPAGRHGFLLVAPDGADSPGGTGWGHVGSPHQARNDLAFLLAVLADVERRWPIDRAVVVAGGFSQGGSMVWDLACYAAPQFTAFIPFSGGFWQPLPERCANTVALRHTHGLHDHMVPMTGRALLADQFHQGNILDGLSRWRAADRCAAMPDAVAQESDLLCTRWTQCGAGEVELCLHDGDHSMIEPWLEASLRWAITASASAAPAVR